MDDNLNDRQGRAQQETQRRRRRGDGGMAVTERLPIPQEIKARLEAEGRVTRWVNDEGNRIHQFTVQDDYDKVEGVEPVPIGTATDGSPILAHLLSKPLEFVLEDRAEAEKRIKATEDALFRQPSATDQSAKGSNPNPASAERYVTSDSKLRRGNQVLDS